MADPQAATLISTQEPDCSWHRLERHDMHWNRRLIYVKFSTQDRSSFAAALVSLAALAGTASAETTWQKNHPRAQQVNHRLANQNKRIHNDVKNGTLTQGAGGQPAP